MKFDIRTFLDRQSAFGLASPHLRTSAFALAAISIVMVTCNPASAGVFDVITKPVKSIGAAVGKVTKEVDRTAGRAAKGAGRTIGKAAKTVGKAVGGAGKTAQHVAKKAGREIGRTAPKLLDATGSVVSKGYGAAGKVMGVVPGLSAYKSLAEDMSRCAASGAGKTGGAIGAGAGLLTGGAAGIAVNAGRGAVTGCFARDAYRAGRDQVRSFNRDVSGVRRSFR